MTVECPNCRGPLRLSADDTRTRCGCGAWCVHPGHRWPEDEEMPECEEAPDVCLCEHPDDDVVTADGEWFCGTCGAPAVDA